MNAAIESLGWNDPNLATRLQSGVEWQLESSSLYTLDKTISSIFQVVYITSIGAEYAAGYVLLAGPQGIITGAGGVLLLADAGDKTQELFTGRNKFREWVDSMPITDKEKQIILCSKEIAVIIIQGAGAASYAPKSLVGNVDDFVASQSYRLSSKLGAKIGKGQLSFPKGRAGFDQAVETVQKTLSNPSKTTSIIPKTSVRGDYDLIHIFSSETNHTVSLRVLENGQYEFDTLIQGMSSKF